MNDTFLNGRVTVKVADITLEEVDAVVNAANSTLLGGGGVDGAIHARGGPAILDACREIREREYPAGLPTGEAVITTGGELPAWFVIHTVGPIYGRNDGRDDELLAKCYANCLTLAADRGLTSIAFPAISTGAFYFPKDRAAQISSATIANFLDNEVSLNEVRLVFFSESDRKLFLRHQDFDRSRV